MTSGQKAAATRNARKLAREIAGNFYAAKRLRDVGLRIDVHVGMQAELAERAAHLGHLAHPELRTAYPDRETTRKDGRPVTPCAR